MLFTWSCTCFHIIIIDIMANEVRIIIHIENMFIWLDCIVQQSSTRKRKNFCDFLLKENYNVIYFIYHIINLKGRPSIIIMGKFMFNMVFGYRSFMYCSDFDFYCFWRRSFKYSSTGVVTFFKKIWWSIFLIFCLEFFIFLVEFLLFLTDSIIS